MSCKCIGFHLIPYLKSLGHTLADSYCIEKQEIQLLPSVGCSYSCRLTIPFSSFFKVVAFFSAKLEKSAPSPYSSQFVLDTILQASKAWPRNRLRVSVYYRFELSGKLYGQLELQPCEPTMKWSKSNVYFLTHMLELFVFVSK